MTFGLSQDWVVRSAGGSTGDAFMGIHGGHDQVFLKRNTSPFLAALSAEEITPKLLWTKRLSNGDVLTAQEWITGKTLKAKDMALPQTANLLAKVHSSNLLKNMLEKIGGNFVTPQQMLVAVRRDLKKQQNIKAPVTRGVRWLSSHPLSVSSANYRVCHGDLNKKNWLETTDHILYLVDWDQAMLTDPMYDVTTVLVNYVPFKQWSAWLGHYGVILTAQLMQRIQWYAVLQLVQQTVDASVHTVAAPNSKSKLDTLLDLNS